MKAPRARREKNCEAQEEDQSRARPDGRCDSSGPPRRAGRTPGSQGPARRQGSRDRRHHQSRGSRTRRLVHQSRGRSDVRDHG
nr:MAG TPA: hypothetical protein [Caudoviricetes sp.]